jgi:hypothetical protein
MATVLIKTLYDDELETITYELEKMEEMIEDIDGESLLFYVYRFRYTDSLGFDPNPWMAAVVGPIPKEQDPSPASLNVCSNYKNWDELPADMHMKGNLSCFIGNLGGDATEGEGQEIGGLE